VHAFKRQKSSISIFSRVISFSWLQAGLLSLLIACPSGAAVLADQSDGSERKAATVSEGAGKSVANKEGPRPRIGLALAGGGARGCAHVGVIRVLKEEGIPIDCIAGTSMGSVVGGFYAAGLSLDQIEKLLSNRTLLHAYDTVPIALRVALIPIFFVPHIFGYKHYDGLYRGNAFASYIRKSVPEEHRTIESLPIPFAAVASNLLDGKAYAITRGDIGRAVQASSAIPFLRRPVEIEDKLFIDGGIVMNLPCRQARELGADFVIAVDVDDDLKKLEKKDFRKIGSSLDRALNMHLSAIDSYQLEKADFVIHPDVTGITLLDGNPRAAIQAIKSGEEITRKLLPILKMKLEEHSISVTGKVNKANDKSE
jgi:NTE family protein